MRALATALAVVAVLAAACVTVDVTRHGKKPRKTDPRLREAKKVLKVVKDFKDAKEAYDYALDNIDYRDELAVGQAAAVALIKEADGVLLEDAPLTRYVNEVTNLVAMQGERLVKDEDGEPRVQARRFFTVILVDDQPTAYSTPGGHVLITTALLETVNSESELAFIVGHEIAHVDDEDGLRSLKLAKGLPAAAREFLSKKDQIVFDAFADQGVFNELADLLARASYSLGAKEEREADERGLDYAVEAGYDGEGALRVLAALEAARSGTAGERWSHDTPSERVKRLESAARRAKGHAGYERWQDEGLPRLEAALASFRQAKQSDTRR